jgi:hypothetical protein
MKGPCTFTIDTLSFVAIYFRNFGFWLRHTKPAQVSLGGSMPAVLNIATGKKSIHSHTPYQFPLIPADETSTL